MKTISLILALGLLSAGSAAGNATGTAAGPIQVPILAYHRFGPTVADSMTVRNDTFAWQLGYLKEHGYTIIPLEQLVDYIRGGGAAPASHSVVITADDGHRSVYSDMLPVVKQYGFHVTLFIYPSAISNASYAMTWAQLAELVHSGLFDVQSHTYWHPNFRSERARLPAPGYDAFVTTQLVKSKQVLESRLGIRVELLAWPFGIFDDDLMKRARAAGYVAALSIERRPAAVSDPLLALPRFLMTDGDRGAAFARLLEERPPSQEHTAAAAR